MTCNMQLFKFWKINFGLFKNRLAKKVTNGQYIDHQLFIVNKRLKYTTISKETENLASIYKYIVY